MKIFDPHDYPELRDIFPELTPVQFEHSLLYAFGLSQKEISTVRDVSYKVVKASISEAKSQFESKSLTGLLTVIHVRLVLFALYRCQRHRSITVSQE
ncbi:transcriptional regulator [Candidatus Hamiltonella defensa]|uniref:Transcriptional regulator n=1 Tax=Candidatus Williamhamiltonella defendens TaxID=138072 RepID=A0AAC9VM20_9ENTR|nr:transcriptional regulator [Candidatus Hamiltonella defensa]ASV34261.1 transcriptional regulator [Candidatus Hamiltonella defensa]AWK17221.1 transcriptional regulator [Candidatus Hamiltonella defensa]MBK4361151.1 transcriptional regulator [Candidatus Hamiltonella defensa]